MRTIELQRLKIEVRAVSVTARQSDLRMDLATKKIVSIAQLERIRQKYEKEDKTMEVFEYKIQKTGSNFQGNQ